MQSRLRDLILIAVMLVGGANCLADTAQQFDAANKLYEAKQYGDAKSAYDKLIMTGPPSANLYYNRGNAEWRLGDAGNAVLDFERALALEPSHPQARANLEYVRDQTGAKTTSLQWWERALAAMDANMGSIVFAVCGWGALFCIAAMMMRAEGRAGLVLGLLTCILVGAYAGGCIWEAGVLSTKAIIIAKSTQARVAPADVAPVADTLPAGSEVLLPETRGSWTYCTLPDGTRAWVPTEAIAAVKG